MAEDTPLLPLEDEAAFLHRRAAEERRAMDDTSCMVRTVHEDLAELYEAREADARRVTAELEALARRID